MKNAVDDAQLSTNELVPERAVQLVTVRTYSVRDWTAPVDMTDD